jgi:hypothetical protein
MILAQWLKETGRTVDGFAEEISVRRQSVHRWMNGSRFPKRNIIERIQQVSDGKVSAADWFSRQAPAEAAE